MTNLPARIEDCKSKCSTVRQGLLQLMAVNVQSNILRFLEWGHNHSIGKATLTVYNKTYMQLIFYRNYSNIVIIIVLKVTPSHSN